jgi:hypothetical protein
MIESTRGIGHQSEECPPNSPELVILPVTSKSKWWYTMTDSRSAYDQKSGSGDRFPQPLPPSELQSLDLEKVDIPSYVCYHQIMLTFPAKVCKLTVHAPSFGKRETPANVEICRFKQADADNDAH